MRSILLMDAGIGSVVLPVKEYESLLEKIEDLEDTRQYDEVKAKQ